MATLIDGKKVAAELRAKVKAEVATLADKPGLAVVIVGENPASQVYVKMKVKKCEEVGIASFTHELPASTSQEELLSLVEKLNKDKAIHGILVQMPLPKQIAAQRVIEAISTAKDVDGLHPENAGRLVAGQECLAPCTPRGVIALLKAYGIPIAGRHAVVLGRSILVGKPVANLLLNANATVTVCHSKTEDLPKIAREADILIAAIGRKGFVTADMVKEGAVVIDVGITREDGRLHGDVDYESVEKKAGWITPVPGGVGPMTIACLLENTLQAYRMRRGGSS